MKHLIKDLEWQFCDYLYEVVYRVETDVYHYAVRQDKNSGAVEVDYYKEDMMQPSKTATGFKTLDQGKEWAFSHHCEKLSRWLNTDPLTDTVNWFKKAKPEPTIECECVQQGVMFEEMYELLDALGLSESDAGRGLKHLAYLFKTKQRYAILLLASLTHEQRIERLDAMCDIVVTAAGSSYTSKDDFIGALKEVNASNWSKFENGKAVTDENGKIIKGEGYFKPELDKFVGGGDE